MSCRTKLGRTLHTQCKRFTLLMLIALVVGCGQSQAVKDTYGRRTGTGRKSVNGTGVLGSMFESAGYQVRSWATLSPRIEKEDVLVIVIDSFYAPHAEFCDRLEEWLSSDSGRTLIFIGRDYDAAVEYWKEVAPKSSAEQVDESQRRLANAIVKHESIRDSVEEEQSSPWFDVSYDEKPRLAKQLRGPWAGDLDKNVSLPLTSKVSVPEDDENHWAGEMQSESLLKSGREDIVFKVRRAYWDDSQVIVVNNGSFILNLPLVDSTNQILATKLIDECGSASRVMFIEGDSYRVGESDGNAMPTGWEAFTQWPLSAILIHLAFVGILFCFAVFPIFGKPRTDNDDSTSDFGKHIDALGKLLERTSDVAYAKSQLETYDKSRDKIQSQ